MTFFFIKGTYLRHVEENRVPHISKQLASQRKNSTGMHTLPSSQSHACPPANPPAPGHEGQRPALQLELWGSVVHLKLCRAGIIIGIIGLGAGVRLVDSLGIALTGRIGWLGCMPGGCPAITHGTTSSQTLPSPANALNPAPPGHMGCLPLNGTHFGIRCIPPLAKVLCAGVSCRQMNGVSRCVEPPSALLCFKSWQLYFADIK